MDRNRGRLSQVGGLLCHRLEGFWCSGDLSVVDPVTWHLEDWLRIDKVIAEQVKSGVREREKCKGSKIRHTGEHYAAAFWDVLGVVVPYPRHPFLRQLSVAKLSALETATETVKPMNSYACIATTVKHIAAGGATTRMRLTP